MTDRQTTERALTGRALSFGSVAAAYERFRPGYPDRIPDEVLAYAGAPVRTALEIGAGTGKATRVFAAQGIAVTATDPDAAMLAELRTHVPPTVEIVQAALEDLPRTPTPAYDLVFAAAALHWTEPVHRWARVAALLTTGGVFAAFGGQLEIEDPAVAAAVRAVQVPVLPEDDVPSPDGTPAAAPMQWPGSELSRSDRFVDVRQVTVERRLVVSAHDYIGHLSTISAYIGLPSTVRTELFQRLLALLPPRVTLDADVTLHLARLADRAVAPPAPSGTAVRAGWWPGPRPAGSG